MSDYYYFKIKCPYCKYSQEVATYDIVGYWKCKKCKKKFKIVMEFKSKKLR